MKPYLIFFLLLAGSLRGIAQNSDTLPPPPPPPPPPHGTVTVQNVSDTNAVFSYAEQMPQFPGGQAAFFKFLQDSIRYPIIEKENGLQGTVYVSFVVEKDGSITSIQTVKGVPGAPGLSREAERVIGLMPKWTPGKLNGKPVRVNITQPIKFVLPADTPKKKKKHR